MANKTMDKNKTLKESKNLKTARDIGITSTGLLGSYLHILLISLSISEKWPIANLSSCESMFV